MSDLNAREIALTRFAEKFNCAEAVLLGLAEANGFKCGCIPRIATGFGGGFAGCGEVCGAVAGAVMALGLKFGRERADDLESKSLVSGKVQSLMDAFQEEFGSVLCVDLTGCVTRTPEGMAEAKARDLHNTFCPKFVAFAAEVTQKMIESE